LPWKETCAMKERIQLVSLYETRQFTVTELAKRFGVSRKTVYKWVNRHSEEGIPGLNERSRAPQRCPRATPAEVVMAVIRAKRSHTTWGPGKLLPGTETPPEVAKRWPAVSTRGRILAQHGLVKRRRKRHHTPPWTQPFLHANDPNDVWCADFKGHFPTADGTRCDPLTISDACTRMLICCEILTRTDYAHVRPVFERIFREYGLPLAIRTDNGPPFASVGVGGLTTLSAWWMKLGIIPERILPGHPEQNGRHERLHRTLKQDTMSPPAADPAVQQARCDEFRLEYNTERPHEALGQVPPATLYKSSPRAYPRHLGDLVYPPLSEVRRVRSNGQIKWRGGLVYISQSLVGELVGITEGKDAWLVSYGPIALGSLYPHRSKLERLPPSPPPHISIPCPISSQPLTRRLKRS
jgi:transposase InsO family protein